MGQNISKEELDERIAITKRFKALLEEQREKFRQYLNILESQESRITEEETESLYAHSKLEIQMVEGIASLQKVIIPMQDLYIRANASGLSKNAPQNNALSLPDAQFDISDIQKDLSDLRDRVLEQNKKNRALIEERMEHIRYMISDFRNPYKSLNSIYAGSPNTGNRVYIEA